MYCNLCPRRCGIDRSSSTGFCNAPENLKIARAALHFWEEPCISGTEGSGTIFFSGCSLGCVYCQNYEIALGNSGLEVSDDRLVEIMLELQNQMANNINLVTPDHYALVINRCIKKARSLGLKIPVVTNTGGYLSAECFTTLNEITDVWLTDFKYFSHELSELYSNAPDYREVALDALRKMVEEKGELRYRNGILQSGVIVRILLLPGALKDAKAIIDLLYPEFGNKIIYSLMNQYTPPPQSRKVPDILRRKVSRYEYDHFLDYAVSAGITNAYIQEEGTADDSFIPPFDYTGVIRK